MSFTKSTVSVCPAEIDIRFIPKYWRSFLFHWSRLSWLESPPKPEPRLRCSLWACPHSRRDQTVLNAPDSTTQFGVGWHASWSSNVSASAWFGWLRKFPRLRHTNGNPLNTQTCASRWVGRIGKADEISRSIGNCLSFILIWWSFIFFSQIRTYLSSI